jgi:hypothetical protein
MALMYTDMNDMFRLMDATTQGSGLYFQVWPQSTWSGGSPAKCIASTTKIMQTGP